MTQTSRTSCLRYVCSRRCSCHHGHSLAHFDAHLVSSVTETLLDYLAISKKQFLSYFSMVDQNVSLADNRDEVALAQMRLMNDSPNLTMPLSLPSGRVGSIVPLALPLSISSLIFRTIANLHCWNPSLSDESERGLFLREALGIYQAKRPIDPV